MSPTYDYSTLFYLNPLPNWVYEIDTFQILDVNQAATQHYGYSREEFLGMTIKELRPEEHIPKLLDAHKEIEKKQENISFGVFTHQKKCGERISMDINGHKIDFLEKQCMLITCRDVTLEKKEEQHLKLLESVITNTNDAILITEAEPFDEPGPRIIFVNEAFTKMTGYTSQEVIGKTPRILQGPKSDKEELDRLSKAIRKWESCEITTINYKKNGEPFWINFSVSPVADEDGWYTHWIAIERDVSELNNEKIQNELLAEISSVFSIKTDLKKSLDQLCQLTLDFGEYSFCEVWLPNMHQNALKLYAKQYSDSSARRFYQEASEVNAFDYGEGLPGLVWKKMIPILLENAGQEELFIRNNAAKKAGLNTVFGFPLIHQNEKVGMMIVGAKMGSFQVRRHQSTLAKLESFVGSEIKRKRLEGELSYLFDYSPDIICLTDFNGKFLKINKAGCKILGYQEKDIIGFPFDNFVHPADKDISTNEVLNLNENAFNFENRLVKRNGEVVWLSWNGNASLDEGVIYATAKDITEEKKLKELVNDASKMARFGGWEIDLVNDQIHWSEVVHQIHETDPMKFKPSLNKGLDFYREDHKLLVSEIFENTILTGEPFDYEAPLITALGNQVWIRAIGSTEFSNGRCIRIFGSFQDIHSSKSNSLQLEEVLGSISDAFFAVDRNWNITYFNKEAENIFQRKEKDLLGKNIWKELEPAKDSFLSTTFEKVSLTQKSENLEYNYPGDGKWYQINMYPSNGGVSVYLKNIDNRKRTEEKLQKAYDEKNKILESIGDAFFAVNNDFIVTYWNNTAERLIGVKRNEVLGKNLWEVFPDAVKLSFYDNYHKVLQNNESITFEEYYGIWLEVNAYPSDKGISIFFRDISERREQEKELQALNDMLKKYIYDLETSNEQLEQFAFIASHDLQEPLRMISSYLNLLQNNYRHQLDQKASKYIFFAADGAKKMKRIILDLLEYSRAGKFSEGLEVTHLDEIMQDYLMLRKRIIKEKSAKISIDKLPKVVCFRVPLVQTLHSLLDNAIKYSKEDIPSEISLSVFENEEEWSFQIKDNGIGIDPIFFDKIFIIFQRLHNRDQYSGTGIGLSIAKKNVESWGGKIWVESKPDAGSAFYFTIKKPKE
ncbi:PAS domain S-box protein [Mongoliibacter ruber]|nr:PAS domain S-box protein [Mongoliibacter ruber]